MSSKYIVKINSCRPLCWLFVLVLGLFSPGGLAQITDGTVDPDKKVRLTKVERNAAFESDTLEGINFFMTGLYQYSYRDFEDGSGFDYYEELEDQTATYNGGVSMGLMMELTKNFHVEIGMSYFGNGERHVYRDSLTDSSFTYQNTYVQLALPFRLRYVYGDQWQVFGFAGLAPLNILNVRYESSYVTEIGTPVERDPEKITQGFATFNLMLSAGIGVCYNVRYVGFMIYPEYRRHLLNTYSTKTISIDHKMYGIGVNAGFLFRF
jgi:hypothetical protein